MLMGSVSIKGELEMKKLETDLIKVSTKANFYEV